MTEDETTEVRQAFETALLKLDDHPVWRVVCARAQAFSLLIGCPSAPATPLDCITGIRIHMSSSASHNGHGGAESRERTGNRSSNKRTHEDYTVAWICPLEVEQIAALEMLDTQHERLPQPNGDENVYTLGAISSHNVVIAGLPRAGNCSAATVVTQARGTFPNLRFCLLVGIGGGVPVTTDNGMIRLGDIVVSKPAATHSGVVQYDHGKAQEGYFQRTGALAAPSALLLGAAQALAAHRARSRADPLVRNMERIDTTIRGLRKYKHPGLSRDYLYRPDYVHKIAGQSCLECGCDPAQRIQRGIEQDKDDPFVVVHRGTIASGELVMRSGKLRDDLAKQHDVLCFETEAAGVLTNFPCMVIRGISDYSDSHKNDEWQAYAAAAAAAYARELFIHMPINESHER
jgi:nucleoside phosphorylase